MKKHKSIICLILLTLSLGQAQSDVGFTQQDLDLVKGACLAGNSFEFSTEADGSISVKSLEGRGVLHVTKKEVDTVDLPESDKKQEFNDIRACIKEYLFGKGTNREGQLNRAKQFGDQNELDQTSYRGQSKFGPQSNDIVQSGNGNKARQINR